MVQLTLALFIAVMPFLCNAEEHWDFFMFTQSWPPAVCIDVEKTHTCKIPNDVKTWTIHGLWPTRKGTEGPANCNSSWHFHEEDIKYLEPQLNKFWPNLYTDIKQIDFWKHEWEKHGTCSTNLPSVHNESLYFQSALKLNQQYNIMGILAEKGILPDEHATYKSKDVLDALKSVLGITPKVECAYDKKTGNHVLYEVKICIDKNFNMVDCFSGDPGSVGRLSSHRNHNQEYINDMGSPSYSNCPDNGFLYPVLSNMSFHVIFNLKTIIFLFLMKTFL